MRRDAWSSVELPLRTLAATRKFSRHCALPTGRSRKSSGRPCGAASTRPCRPVRRPGTSPCWANSPHPCSASGEGTCQRRCCGMHGQSASIPFPGSAKSQYPLNPSLIVITRFVDGSATSARYACVCRSLSRIRRSDEKPLAPNPTNQHCKCPTARECERLLVELGALPVTHVLAIERMLPAAAEATGLRTRRAYSPARRPAPRRSRRRRLPSAP